MIAKEVNEMVGNPDMKEYDEDDFSPEAVEAAARRNRASWRRDCEDICRSEGYPAGIRNLADRLIRLIDKTEGMYHGEPLDIKAMSELLETLDELRERLG